MANGKSFVVKGSFSSRLPLISGFIITILILWLPMRDPDFWWHMRLGQQMLQTHALPRTEQFTWSMQGKPFVDFYWLSELIIAQLYNILPLTVLSLLFAVVGFYILYIRTRSLTLFTWRNTIAFASMAVLLQPVYNIRPVVFSWFLFVLLLLFIDNLSRFRRVTVGVLGFILFILWVNLHHGFALPYLYLFLLLGLHCLFWFLQRLDQQWAPKPFLSNNVFIKLCILASAAIISIVITPYGIQTIQAILREAASPQNRMYISEWQPLIIRHQVGLVYFPLALFVFAMAAYQRLWKPWQWIIYFCFFIIGASAHVHAPFFLILIAPTFIIALHKIKMPKELTLYAKIYMLPMCSLAAVLLFVFTWKDSWQQKHFEDTTLPVQAVLATQKLQPVGRMFNDYTWGGYLEFMLPQYQTMLDGRMTSWQDGNSSLFADTVTIESLKPGFLEKLQYYNPDWFFIRSDIPLTQWLKLNPSYKVIYEDSVAVIIVKR